MIKNRISAAFFVTCLLACSSVSHAQGTDPGDLAFWQSIQNSTNPAEFRAYLQVYPNGRFAELAKLRAGGPGPQPAPARPGGTTAQVTPTPSPAPAPPVEDPASDYTIAVAPPAARVGQVISFNCSSLPQGGSYDKLVVVPAGTPEMSPNLGRDENKVLWAEYVANCKTSTPKGGPFAPGAYEVRWMTTLFNNDSPTRFEMKAKTSFTVR
eukprot:gene5956-6027_t